MATAQDWANALGSQGTLPVVPAAPVVVAAPAGGVVDAISQFMQRYAPGANASLVKTQGDVAALNANGQTAAAVGRALGGVPRYVASMAGDGLHAAPLTAVGHFLSGVVGAGPGSATDAFPAATPASAAQAGAAALAAGGLALNATPASQMIGAPMLAAPTPQSKLSSAISAILAGPHSISDIEHLGPLVPTTMKPVAPARDVAIQAGQAASEQLLRNSLAQAQTDAGGNTSDAKYLKASDEALREHYARVAALVAGNPVNAAIAPQVGAGAN